MRKFGGILCVLVVLCATTGAQSAAITISYTQDAGGANTNPLNGLAALATFESTGDQLSILLQNTSTGLPVGFGAADSLLVSLGFNLPAGIHIVSGNTAVIGPGSTGLSQWSSRGSGDSVSEEWAWTNIGGGDLLNVYRQVISTSAGNQGQTRFGGGTGTVAGPFGGIAASPPLASIPGPQRAVSDSILFGLTLSSGLTVAQLHDMAHDSIVEYGSDVRYLHSKMPEPASLVLLAFAALPLLRYRRHRLGS